MFETAASLDGQESQKLTSSGRLFEAAPSAEALVIKLSSKCRSCPSIHIRM